jgi:putative transposase
MQLLSVALPMAAIIDWHSKAVLSHRISNTMDSQLVMSVLNDALEKHPHPEIFNTDQGSPCSK